MIIMNHGPIMQLVNKKVFKRFNNQCLLCHFCLIVAMVPAITVYSKAANSTLPNDACYLARLITALEVLCQGDQHP